MLCLGLYLIVTLIALSWVMLDHNARAAFEVFEWSLHSTAREMGMYREWLLQSLIRAVLLISFVIIGIVAATWMLLQNPWNLEWLGRASLFAAMITFSIATLVMPHLSAHVRLWRFLNFKATELSDLVSVLSTNEGVYCSLEPAEQGVFDGADGWTAWHPRAEEWKENPLWSGLVPVVYLYQSTATSLIVPVDFEHFLAWKLPDGGIMPGKLMPFWPSCLVKAVRRLRGCEGWSIVHAELQI